MNIKYIILLAIPVISTGCRGKSASEAAPAVPVQTAVAEVRSVSYYDTYPAVVVALDQVEVFPQVSGYVTAMHFADGQKVRKGQKLYTIDQQQYQGAYDQARANLDAARAEMVKAVQDSARYASLMARDAVARQSYDYAVAGARSARMQAAAAEAAVSSAQTNLRYSVIASPLEGTIGISQVRLGAAVIPGQTLMNTVSVDDPMAVDFAVDEKQIPRFTALLNAPADDSLFIFVLPGGERYEKAGKLLLMDRAVDPATATITVRASFPNPQGILKAGMSGNMTVRASTPGPVALIPGKAVTEQMGEFYVYLVKNGKAVRRMITTGRTLGPMIIARSGVEAGDSVVTEGVQRLYDGAVVTVAADTVKQHTR